MKKRLLLTIVLANCLIAKAQLVFRNAGCDTIVIAIGTFYDTTQRGTMAEGVFAKRIVTRGWYKMPPGDSLVARALCGPAVYYHMEHVKWGRSVNGDGLPVKSADLRASYREELFVRYDPKEDTSKFAIKHPPIYGGDERTHIVMFFRAVLIPDKAKQEQRFVVDINECPQKG